MKIGRIKHVCNRSIGGAGFTLMEVAIAVLLSSVLFVGLAGALGQFSAQQKQLMSRLSAMSLTTNLRRTLSDDSALLNTLFNTGNEIFDCLRAPTVDPLAGGSVSLSGCAGKSGSLKSLISSSGQKLADFSDPTAGFTSSGEACTGFGTDPQCTSKVRMNVKFVCDQDVGGGPSECVKPQIVFTGSLEMLNEGPSGPTTTLTNLFEVRKDWAALSTRLVELTKATSSSPEIKAFKLAIIVDNSTSMLSYQEKLSAALDPMFESLKNSSWDLSVQIYSSTQFIMTRFTNYEFSKPTDSPDTILKLSSISCQNGATTKSGYCEYNRMSGTQIEKYELKPPVEMVLPTGASMAEFTAFKTSVLNTVASMGVAGSDDEQSLCTLGRLLVGGNGFINPGDKVGVILISNEQDHSSPQTCADEIDRNYIPNGQYNWTDGRFCRDETSYDPITNFIDYQVKVQVGAANYRINTRCQQSRDGNLVPYDPADRSTYVDDAHIVNTDVADTVTPQATAMSSYSIDIDKTCAASGIVFTGSEPYTYAGDTVTMLAGECPASVRAVVEGRPSCGKTVPGIEGCKVLCNDQINYGLIDVSLPATEFTSIRQVDNFSTNYCAAPFSVDMATSTYDVHGWDSSMSTYYYKTYKAGGDYANIAALFMTNNFGKTLWTPIDPASRNCCRTPAYYAPYPSGVGDVYKSIFEPFGTHMSSIEKAIVDRANDLLGEDGYFISSIINPSDPSTACPMKPDESVGSVFESLAGRVKHSTVVPICSADYSPALDPLKDFITHSIASGDSGNDIITLNQGEQIVQVYVNNGTATTQFSVAGPNGVWPTLIKKVDGSTSKVYRLDFSKTGYNLAATDRVWALVASQTGSLKLGSIGTDLLSFDQIRSLYRIGLGH